MTLPTVHLPFARAAVVCTGSLRSRLTIEIDVTPTRERWARLYMGTAPQPIHEGLLGPLGPNVWEVVDAAGEAIEFGLLDVTVEARLAEARRIHAR